MIIRHIFFPAIRSLPFPGKMNQGQVNGINIILNEWERRGLVDLKLLAYILATTKHETAHTMQPIKEMGGLAYLKSKRYYPWFGRGYVQLTWKYNYEAFHKEVLALFKADIIANPDLVLRPDVAAYILFEGMLKGTFNAKKKGLAFYLNDESADWVQARRTVNVLDKAVEIAGIAKQFYADLILASKE